MKKFKAELLRLQEELKNTRLSKERVMEIKDETLLIANKMDSLNDVSNLSGTVKELYRVETKYPKRRVKKAVDILLGAVK